MYITLNFLKNYQFYFFFLVFDHINTLIFNFRTYYYNHLILTLGNNFLFIFEINYFHFLIILQFIQSFNLRYYLFLLKFQNNEDHIYLQITRFLIPKFFFRHLNHIYFQIKIFMKNFQNNFRFHSIIILGYQSFAYLLCQKSIVIR